MTESDPPYIDPSSPPRRNFLSLLLGGTFAAALAPMLYVVARYLHAPKSLPSTTVVGAESEIAPETARTIKVGLADAIVMRGKDRSIYALNLRCTHAGCNVAWRAVEGKFYCPCHGGEFDREGKVTKGPPTRPLEHLTVQIENGIVKVTNE
jgi:nitrite reductase/ring-hydroxylating ferredoxin subunit